MWMAPSSQGAKLSYTGGICLTSTKYGGEKRKGKIKFDKFYTAFSEGMLPAAKAKAARTWIGKGGCRYGMTPAGVMAGQYLSVQGGDREDPLDRFDSVRPLVDAEREEWALRVDSAKESIRATLENAWNEGALGIERTRFGGDFFAFSAQPKWGGTVELFRPPEKPVPEIRIEYNPDDPDDCDPDDCE